MSSLTFASDPAVVSSTSNYATAAMVSEVTLADVTGNQVADMSGTLNAMQADATTLTAQTNDYASLSASLQALKATLVGLEDGTAVGGLTATSSSSAIGVALGSDGVAGTYTVSVTQLAAAQVNHSAASTALSTTAAAFLGSGTLGIQVGTGSTVNVAITNAMSVTQIAAAINSANAGVTASVITSGTQYEVQVTGNNTGAANAVTYTDNGTSLKFSTYQTQAAVNSAYTVNGTSYSSATNAVAVNGVPGATLSFTALVSNATITLSASSASVQTAASSFVTAYNSTISAINTALADTSGKVERPILLTLEKQLSRIVANPSTGASGTYQSLADIGIYVNSDGTYSVNANALAASATANAASIVALFSGNSSNSTGLAANLLKVAVAFGEAGVGVFDRLVNRATTTALRSTRSIARQQRLVASKTNTVQQSYSSLQTALSRYSLQSLMVQALSVQSGLTTNSSTFNGSSNTSNSNTGSTVI